MVQPGLKRPTRDYGERIDELVEADDRNGLVKHFMRNAVGIPAPFVTLMRLSPMWKGLRSTAHTLGHDWAALGAHTMYGAPLDPEEWAGVTMPALVVYGGKSPEPLREGSKALGAVLPDAELIEIPGAGHNIKTSAVVPLIAKFFTAPARAAVRYSHPGSTKIAHAVIGAMMIMLMPHCSSRL